MTVHYVDDWLTIHQGDCRAVLATMPEQSVHCVVTSPPFWGLRDYGTATWGGGDASCEHLGSMGTPYHDRCGKCGAVRIDVQLGLEPTPEAYVANMVAVFREVHRVLRDDGTLWINLGDSYNIHGGNDNRTNGSDGARLVASAPRHSGLGAAPGLKPKDLVGIPWRVAFALQADGWYLRSDIIWAKPNPMPESVTDRPTKSHEYVFLLAKSERYYFDADAVREASEGGLAGGRQRAQAIGVKVEKRLLNGQPSGNGHNMYGWDHPAGRNIRSVWTIATAPYKGSHFATFPPKLVEPCIKAGTSERGVCPDCGTPWRRVVERERHIDPRPMTTGAAIKDAIGEMARTTPQGRTAGTTSVTTTGWRPGCAHDKVPVPATVMDIFGGSGTTAMVAQSLSRRAILIDLNPEYIAQQLHRNVMVPLGLGVA